MVTWGWGAIENVYKWLWKIKPRHRWGWIRQRVRDRRGKYKKMIIRKEYS